MNVFLLCDVQFVFSLKQTCDDDHKLLQILTFLQLHQPLIGLVSLLLQDLALTIKISASEHKKTHQSARIKFDAAHFYSHSKPSSGST